MGNFLSPIYKEPVHLVHALMKISAREKAKAANDEVISSVYKGLGGGGIFHGNHNRLLAHWIVEQSNRTGKRPR